MKNAPFPSIILSSPSVGDRAVAGPIPQATPGPASVMECTVSCEADQLGHIRAVDSFVVVVPSDAADVCICFRYC